MGGERSEAEWIYVGRVARAHGVKGGLALKLENQESGLLREGVVLRFEPPEKLARELVVERAYKGDAVEVEGVRDRDAAEELHGASVYVRRSDFPPLDDDELYLVDWIGAAVKHDDDGRLLGVIESFSDNTAQPLAEVRVPSGDLVLMPFVPGILVDTDESAREVRVRPPGGMFEGEALEVPPAGGGDDEGEA